jgi:SAM-dependent methyltransferase
MRFFEYNQLPTKHLQAENGKIASFISDVDENIDNSTVDSFGEEWLKFNQFSEEDIKTAGNQYFDIVPEFLLNENTCVLDAGCGSGRWTKFIAGKVKIVEAIDPSLAVLAAQKMNKDNLNVRITNASISNIPFDDESFDFIICLGVLHHIPNTQKALSDTVKKLKTGGHILLYLYYNLDNRGVFYKLLFHTSSVFRIIISRLPVIIKKTTCDIIACLIYFPIAFLIKILKGLFGNKNWINKMPLAYYSNKSFKIMRNDALDRFGTPLEQRFTKEEIGKMLTFSGIASFTFSDNEPYWHVLGKKV